VKPHSQEMVILDKKRNVNKSNLFKDIRKLKALLKFHYEYDIFFFSQLLQNYSQRKIDLNPNVFLQIDFS